MKTNNSYTPSKEVLRCIAGIKNLNKNHNGDLTGIWIALMSGDRYTKEEIKYMKTEIDEWESFNQSSN